MSEDAVPLREHLKELLMEVDLRNQQRFEAQEKAVQAALVGAERAVLKAEAAAEKRFEAMNEIRGAMSDQGRMLIGREEALARMSGLEEKVGALTERLDKAEGSGSGLKAGWGYLIGGVGLLLAILAFLSRVRP